ncbi:MAG: hypothetical protein IJT11_03930 [Bacteroidaceae bacterium]|nr:hypothetical protein [Bacteroidaceae bacterium]
MARECKAGSWLFRINPNNEKELQIGLTGSTSYSHLWSAPNGERILDIIANGDEVAISTDRHYYVRRKSGSINLS